MKILVKQLVVAAFSLSAVAGANALGAEKASGAKPAALKLSDKSRAVLVKMLECTSFMAVDSPEAAELLEKEVWSNELVQLHQPVMVFGLPVSKIKVSGDGSEGIYFSYFTNVDKQQIVKSANLKLSKRDKKYYYRDAKVGQLSYKHADPEISLKCYINTEG